MPYPTTAQEIKNWFCDIKNIQAIQNAVERNEAIHSIFGELFINNLSKLESLRKLFFEIPKDAQSAEYQQLLIYCTFRVLLENNGLAKEQAKKLYTIFNKNLNKIKNYLYAFTNQHLDSPEPMHDACNFAIPSKDCEYTLEVWAALSAKHLTEPSFRGLLAQAPNIEEFIKSSAQAIPYANRSTKKVIYDFTKEIKTLNKSIKKRHSQNSKLTDEEKIQLQEDVNILMHKKSQLTTMGIPFNNELSLTALTVFREIHMLQASKSYKQFLENGLTKKDHDKFINLERQDSDELIPPLRINGGSRYYLMKVPVLDEAHAARAAYFGKLTNCCQSLSGEAGEPCVIHGLTSPNGGFYVICHGDVNNPQITDEVLGQSWVWRGKENEFVFDSIEITKKEEGIYKDTREIVKNLVRQAAAQLTTHFNIERVLCGATSGISAGVGITAAFEFAEFKDYTDYSDSINQQILRDKHRPFYFTGISPEDTQTNKQWIIGKLKSNSPLTDANSLWEAINWMFLSGNAYLIKEIQDLARQEASERLEETNILINDLKEYFESGLTSKILDLIKNHAFPLEARNITRETPVIQAIRLNNIEALKTFIQYGAHLEKSDSVGKTGLIYAVQHGFIEIFMELINRNVNLEHADHDGKTALIHAIASNNSKFFIELINRNVNLEHTDHDGKTALIHAIVSNNTEIFLELINRNVNLEHADHDGKTALIYAIESNNIEFFLELINRNVNLEHADHDGKTALMYAIASNNIEFFLALMNRNVNLKQVDNDGETVLMYAAKYKKIDIFTKLIQKNMNPEQVDKSGQTALIHAICSKSIAIINVLIQAQANFEHVDKDGNSILRYATDTGDNEIISMIKKQLIFITAIKEIMKPVLFSEWDKVRTTFPSSDLFSQNLKHLRQTKKEHTESDVIIRHNRPDQWEKYYATHYYCSRNAILV